jgi:PAS domain S-box-containing protein
MIDKRWQDEHYRQWLASIVEDCDDAIISKNIEGIITSWNRGAEKLFGYTPSEAIGQPVTILIPEDRLDEESEILRKLKAGTRTDHFETLRRRKDGTLIDVSLTISPVRDAQGLVVGASKVARDITERKRVQERDALLQAELQHRAKNLLAVIEGLARNSRPRNEPAVDQFLRDFVPRLQALLSVGEIIMQSSDRCADFKSVVSKTLAPFQNAGATPRISMEGPSLTLSERTAGGLSLALHELATNAIKYGALKSSEGRVFANWNRTPVASGSRIEIEWKERSPLPVRPSTRRGFGTRVIQSAVSSEREGRTDFRFEPDGVRCRFEFLVPEIGG